MSRHAAIQRELFLPRDEELLTSVEVQRRPRKRISFISAGSRPEYATFICLSVTNTPPRQLLITKVKLFEGSSSFSRRAQWRLEQLKQVDGIDNDKEVPEFNLVFDNSVEQWVACSSAEKSIFIQILHQACQAYWKDKVPSVREPGLGGSGGREEPHRSSAARRDSFASRSLSLRRKSLAPPRPTEFINCQSALTGDGCSLLLYRLRVFFSQLKDRLVPQRTLPPAEGQLGFQGPKAVLNNLVLRLRESATTRGGDLRSTEDTTSELLHRARAALKNSTWTLKSMWQQFKA